MVQLETQLGTQFIDSIRMGVTASNGRIKACKIHGGDYQVIGISDYLIWYRGYSIAIEFKVAPNVASNAQLDFLQDIIDCGSIGIIVRFHQQWESNFRPFELLESAIYKRKTQWDRIIFENYGYQGKSIVLPKLPT